MRPRSHPRSLTRRRKKPSPVLPIEKPVAGTMVVSLTGKVIIAVVILGVVGGMSATIALIVMDENEVEMTPAPTTEAPGNEILYQVGVGIADMTGPCVEITFMGYAELGQSGQGLHLRQFARTFIFVRGNTRVVLVTAEVQAVGIAVRRKVVRNLQLLYGDMYTLRNVIITGTHTHSAPGGHLVDFLLDISILGFSRETFEAYVDGITRSIRRAHENIAPARLYFSQSKVRNAHMNRSPFSYASNPEEEREKYESNVDDVLSQIRVTRADGSLAGVMNWFAVHTTSMNMTNLLISSDNLGYSALKMEAELNPGALPGRPDIVTGFFSSNLGDVSPNTRGARCEFSGAECDNQFLLCGAQERCFSEGPGVDMFDSTRIIGNAVYEGAMEALNARGEELRGELAVIHQFVDMPEATAYKYDPVADSFDAEKPVNGCFAAMGYSFASGTIDGANTLNITQGTLEGNPLFDLVGGVVAPPTDEDIECHAPKPILLATGRANFPIPWHPRIVSVSLALLGGVAVLGVAGEPTTMAGRRMQRVAARALQRRGLPPRVLVAGLTNEYMHYVSTFEEYQIQRYEAASTIFGPHTLDILLNKFDEFIDVALDGGDVPPGPEPADNTNSTLSLILPVVVDNAPLGRSFGDVLEQPSVTVTRGQTVRARFVAANPRNDLKQESNHAAVERLEAGRWAVYANDADWNTRFTWTRESTLMGTSSVTFEWTVPQNAIMATYRIVYHGAARSLFGNLRQFSGVSNAFTVIDVNV